MHMGLNPMQMVPPHPLHLGAAAVPLVARTNSNASDFPYMAKGDAAALSRTPSTADFSHLSNDAAMSQSLVDFGHMAMDAANKSLHHGLINLLPQPVFVRSATGSILFCNFAATDAVGLPRGEWPQAWQITPQVVSPPYAPGVTSEMRGELDLLRDPVDQHDPVALPAPTSNFNVLLQNSRGIYQSMLCAHRIPFWMASSDNSGTKRAVVLYVGSG